MIQLSNIMLTFAAFMPRTFVLVYQRRAFLCPIGSVVSNDIRLSNPIREYPFSIDGILVLGRTGRRQPFLYLYISNSFTFMPRTNEICNAGNNSTRTATSAHETCAVVLTGNPYQDIASYGFDLHRCTIRYHQSPNNKGNTITGEFNISGRIHTAGATSYAELIGIVVQLRKDYLQYVGECHKRKRDRNRMSWLQRHPEFTNRTTNIYINITGDNNIAQLGVRNLSANI